DRLAVVLRACARLRNPRQPHGPCVGFRPGQVPGLLVGRRAGLGGGYAGRHCDRRTVGSANRRTISRKRYVSTSRRPPIRAGTTPDPPTTGRDAARTDRAGRCRCWPSPYLELLAIDRLRSVKADCAADI